ncbi:MAG: glycosyltransferase family 9 protein [Ignavibacteria bacterium]|nr:glycosyltransferase family 9 protein [Ignavibacteria bacterium]
MAIVSLHRLGDTVFTIPAIKEIIKHYNKDVYIICYEESALIYKEVLLNINYITLSKNDFYLNGRIAKRKTRSLLKAINPKIIFDLTESIKSAFLIFSSPAKELIGSNEEHFRAIYTHFTFIRKSPHLTDAYLDVIKTKFEIENEDDIKEFKVNLSKTGKILIHPFGGWAAKEWELEKFILLAEKLSEEYSVEIIAPINSIGHKEKQEAGKRKISITETSSIGELIEQARDCSIFIGNDSGPLYIASMLGKPTFTIYGPTNPDYSIPFGDHHDFIIKTINCSPEKNKQYCYTLAGMVGCPAFKCMELLDVDEVYNKLLPFAQKHCNKKLKILS